MSSKNSLSAGAWECGAAATVVGSASRPLFGNPISATQAPRTPHKGPPKKAPQKGALKSEGEFGVRLNCVAPGPIADTPGMEKLSGGKMDQVPKVWRVSFKNSSAQRPLETLRGHAASLPRPLETCRERLSGVLIFMVPFGRDCAVATSCFWGVSCSPLRKYL